MFSRLALLFVLMNTVSALAAMKISYNQKLFHTECMVGSVACMADLCPAYVCFVVGLVFLQHFSNFNNASCCLLFLFLIFFCILKKIFHMKNVFSFLIFFSLRFFSVHIQFLHIKLHTVIFLFYFYFIFVCISLIIVIFFSYCLRLTSLCV